MLGAQKKAQTGVWAESTKGGGWRRHCLVTKLATDKQIIAMTLVQCKELYNIKSFFIL